MTDDSDQGGIDRRGFLRATSAIAAGLAAPSLLTTAAWARAADDRIRVGVIGCGGRGTGAAYDALNADPAVRITAMADLFPERLSGSLGHLEGEEAFRGRIDVPEERRFVGFDAFQRLLDSRSVDYVILASSPGFRPAHFDAAIRAGVHVFLEKPVAVDPVGVRRVIEAGRAASQKRLSVVAGTQRRHEQSYLAAMERVRDGAIGQIVSARCYWNQGGLWMHGRKPEYSDVEWMCRNWLYFDWLSGDHICEQHVHNLDAVNWAIGSTPTKAVGMGGRQVRTGSEFGNIFDHFTVEYEYPSGVSVMSMCRQIDGCVGRVEEVLVGTRGTMTLRPNFAHMRNESGEWRAEGNTVSPYMQEHVDLIASIRGGRYLNEAEQVARSTLTAIMGRMSAYTGKEVSWDAAMNSALDLTPARLEFGPHTANPVPTPGRTPLI